MAENTEVVVIGGGYAGVVAADRLTQRADVTVTLLSPLPEFVERIRPHQPVTARPTRSSPTGGPGPGRPAARRPPRAST